MPVIALRFDYCKRTQKTYPAIMLNANHTHKTFMGAHTKHFKAISLTQIRSGKMCRC